MKKIGIATQYTNSCNYGGLLQAYALCYILSEEGYEVRQIRYVEQSHDNIDRLVRLVKNGYAFETIRSRVKMIINNILGRIYHSSDSINKLRNSFKVFRDNIPHTEIIYNEETIRSCTDFDIYLTGSDQVWRIDKYHYFNIFYWLSFVSDDKRKVSYAASISSVSFPMELIQNIKTNLSSYYSISVREIHDKELLENMLGERAIKWVLDPTLLISSGKWNQLCEENKCINNAYVFTYFLGDNVKQRDFVTEWAKRNNRKIINIPYLLGQYRNCDRLFGDIRLNEVTPNLWLALIRDADCVFTDSFHAAVFSCIFHTPFYIFKRSKETSKNPMNSRIYSLMKLLDSENRIISEDTSIDSIPQLSQIDFKNIDKVISMEKEKSMEFLRNAIEG